MKDFVDSKRYASYDNLGFILPFTDNVKGSTDQFNTLPVFITGKCTNEIMKAIC